jgi:AcrR family transcriptional regulator
MGYQHDRNDMLAAAVRLVAEHGLSSLTYKRLADRLGIPDRTVVYYFPTKNDLVAAVLEILGGRLEEALRAVLGDAPLAASELLDRAWHAVQSGEADSICRVYLQVTGEAAAGRSPYATIAKLISDQWIEWFARLLTGPAHTRRQRAAALVAQLDGLMLLRHVAGAESARAAAQGIGLDAASPSEPSQTPPRRRNRDAAGSQ